MHIGYKIERLHNNKFTILTETIHDTDNLQVQKINMNSGFIKMFSQRTDYLECVRSQKFTDFFF